MKKYLYIATACLFLLIIAVCVGYFISISQPIEWTPVYNEHRHGIMAGRTMPSGHFQEELTPAEIKTLVPAPMLSEMTVSGYAWFTQEREIYYAVLYINWDGGDAMVHIGQAVEWSACCRSIMPAEEPSACGKVEYSIFQYDTNGKVWSAFAQGHMNRVPILVRIETKNMDQDKPVFERILENFARFKGESLRLSGIKPG